MDQQSAEQNHFSGWCLIEIFGHQKEAGFCETVYFGAACMFRIDVPGLDEREYTLERPEYGAHTGYKELPIGNQGKARGGRATVKTARRRRYLRHDAMYRGGCPVGHRAQYWTAADRAGDAQGKGVDRR